jgi:hypothetical protein
MSTKQAVLLIHGIGEQRPMDTLRGFVDTVWTSHTEIQNPHAGGDTWSKPDSVSESFELRRLTTPQNTAQIRTDFFEFYWAHLMHGTSYGHLLAWARSLLWRNPATVPRHLRLIYWVLIAAAIIAIGFATYGAVSAGYKENPLIPAWSSGLISLAIVPVVGFVLRKIVGDAARYLHVAPPNIQRRHEIRQAGVKLLTALHQRGYERIVLVGHSLGSVIGYDILTYAWAAVHTDHTPGTAKTDALNELERQVVAPVPQDTPEAFRRAQRQYVEELQANGNPWRVTDFVTLGSPLAHAEILLAKDRAELGKKQGDREFPTCPPRTETIQRDGQRLTRFSFEPDGKPTNPFRVAHHGAPFAATRWTNLYFPSRVIAWGDLVGGPLSPLFGHGVRDIPVQTQMRGGFFSHTLYWKRPKDGQAAHIDALRDVLNLIDQR